MLATFRKFVTTALAAFLLVGASAGVASAKSESWAGVKPATSHWTGHKLGKVQHAKPLRSETWTGKAPKGESWLGENWTSVAR